jgi:hypothetical protein
MAEQQELRALSARARINATSFVNSYEWGDFKGNPSRLMERYFDLHLYLANWRSRCFFMHLPKKLVDRRLLDAFLGELNCAEVRANGDDIISKSPATNWSSKISTTAPAGLRLWRRCAPTLWPAIYACSICYG